jgi:CBS domain containing-hemolysin-like protein
MTLILVYLLLAALLLLLNAFFVLAEFAVVKIRPSRLEQMEDEGRRGARLARHIQSRMDEYLSVCQVGITFTSIGLGFVGEPAFAQMILSVTGLSTKTAHTVAITLSYLLVSFLHILLGELVPKSLAIRRPEGAVLFTSRPLAFFRWLLHLPILVLNGSANLILSALGVSVKQRESEHSEEELKILLSQSQSVGLMSFRRLLLLENIFDLADVRVRDAMRGRDAVKVLRLGVPWEENFKVIRDSRLSRLPLVDGADLPLGIVHIKDLVYEGPERMASADLRKIARPFLSAAEDAPLETLLGEMQKQRTHLAIVKNAEGRWTGIVALEDVLEEIVGDIEDEFETEPPISLGDALSPGRVVLEVDASGIEEAIGQIFGRIGAGELPGPPERIVKAVLDRERAMSTYLGNGLAIPHARIERMEKPLLLFGRSAAGVPVKGREEKAHFLFVLLTPTGNPRAQVRLLARICGLMGSEYLVDRLKEAASPAAVVEAVRAAEPMATLG